MRCIEREPLDWKLLDVTRGGLIFAGVFIPIVVSPWRFGEMVKDR